MADMNERAIVIQAGCPEVDGVPFESVDDDETGTCYSSDDTFQFVPLWGE